jgi:hypothetical protein
VRARSVVVGLAVIAVLVAVGVYYGTQAMRSGVKIPGLHSEYCTATTAKGEATLDLEQMANAATIAAVGIRRGVPERAVTVAIATAFQESHLYNLSGGDRDSVGLFQQRPSQGWGSEAQISDPRYAAGKFYSALIRVKNWQSMSVTKAAQTVQRSAHPTAYQKWADESTIVAGALLGDASHAIACTLHGAPATRGPAALVGLNSLLRDDWGDLIRLSSVSDPDEVALSVSDDRVGWQYAHWLVAHAEANGVMRVRFGDQQWTAKAGAWGSASDPETAAPGETVLAQVYGVA